MMSAAQEAHTAITCITWAGIQARDVMTWEICETPLQESKSAEPSVHGTIQSYANIPIDRSDPGRIWEAVFCTKGGPGLWVRAKDSDGCTINTAWSMPREDGSPVPQPSIDLFPSINGGWIPVVVVQRLHNTSAVQVMKLEIEQRHRIRFHTPPRSRAPSRCPDAPVRRGPVSRLDHEHYRLWDSDDEKKEAERAVVPVTDLATAETVDEDVMQLLEPDEFDRSLMSYEQAKTLNPFFARRD
jgi:hypothetical protein